MKDDEKRIGQGGSELFTGIPSNWKNQLQNMTPTERRFLLTHIEHIRVVCSGCIVENPQINRLPCIDCISSTTGLFQPLSSIN